MAEDIYFPWHKFQLWLRSGFNAGCLLNKVMISSWPEGDRPYSPKSSLEEVELLEKVQGWAVDTGKREYAEVLHHCLARIKSFNEYPELTNNEARVLWLALSEYGTATESYQCLQNDLTEYLSHAEPDEAIRNGMDALWRSIGPALDPNRDNIEEAERNKDAEERLLIGHRSQQHRRG